MPDQTGSERQATPGRPSKSPAITALIERSRVAKGLPYHVQDPATLAQVAQMVRAVLRDQAASVAAVQRRPEHERTR
jgi:hypothetical protein